LARATYDDRPHQTLSSEQDHAHGAACTSLRCNAGAMVPHIPHLAVQPMHARDIYDVSSPRSSKPGMVVVLYYYYHAHVASTFQVNGMGDRARAARPSQLICWISINAAFNSDRCANPHGFAAGRLMVLDLDRDRGAYAPSLSLLDRSALLSVRVDRNDHVFCDRHVLLVSIATSPV
jgi:hypothetical protein